MKYIICCDFASMECSQFQFAEKLSEFTSSFTNLNNFTWELEIEELDFIPFNSDDICESIYVMLLDFLTPDSFFMVFKASESFSNDIAQFRRFRSRSVSDL